MATDDDLQEGRFFLEALAFLDLGIQASSPQGCQDLTDVAQVFLSSAAVDQDVVQVRGTENV